MTLLCFLLDLRSISPPLLRDLKESLLQLANLYAVTCGRGERERRGNEMPVVRDRIGLCYLQKSRSDSSSSELKVAYRPEGSFSLRDFHHAVRNLPMDRFLLEQSEAIATGSGNQEVSLTSLLRNEALYTWGGEDIVKKVIVIATSVLTYSEALRKSLMDAAEQCVTVEFAVFKQKDVNLYNDASEKLNKFIDSLHEHENCALHKYHPDTWVLCDLAKRWLQELRNDVEEPLQADFLFKNTIVGSVNQISCHLFASSAQIVDGFTSCQTCRCHGCPTSDAVNNKTKGPCCVLTSRELRASDVIETAVRVGEQTILFQPSFDGSPKLRRISAHIKFNVIERTNLASLNEGVISGTSYVVTPAWHEPDAASDEYEKSEMNTQLFHGLCESLFHLDQGLVCCSACNTETMMDGAFKCFYLLQPSDGGPMLLRRLAGSEEMLPNPHIGLPKDLVIPDDVKNSINDSILKVKLRDYNPLQHERGFHQKLNWLVKESLQFGSIPPRTETSLELKNSTHQQAATLKQPSSIQALEEENHHPNQNKDESISSCITDDWEQLFIVDEISDSFSPASISKPKLENSTLTQSRPLDDKTSRILERLEVPKQLKQKVTSPSVVISGPVKKPLLPFDSSSSQPLKPNFQRSKRKR